MMWLLLLLLHVSGIEPVTSQAVNKLILRNGDTLCEGHVEVYHNNQWGLVGDKYWSPATEEVVCRSTHCGERVDSEDVMRPKNLKVWLNELKCTGNETHLWQCENPGWGVSYYRKQTVKKIKCSNTIKLDLDGFQCAGVVKYTKDGKDGKHVGHFCKDNWGASEYNLLCESRGCSKAKEYLNLEWMVEDVHRNSVNMNINCTGIDNMNNLWQCAESSTSPCRNPAAVICEGYERLQFSGNKSNVCSGKLQKEKEGKWIDVIENKTNPEDMCQQMHCGVLRSWGNKTQHFPDLECTDKIEVVLMPNGKESQNECYGEVYIKVNGSTTKPVCASSWTKKEAGVVCRELGCGNVITHSSKDLRGNSAIMDNVKCSGNEASLWHCQAKHKDTQCRSVAYVVCSDNIKWELRDGLGTCSGRLAVQHEGRWKRVSNDTWTKTQSDLVCTHLNCGEAIDSSKKFCKGSGDVLKIDCSKSGTDFSGCDISSFSQPGRGEEVDPVGITCANHRVYFLKGNETCSGEVWVEHGSDSKRLPLSNKEWNQEFANKVCQQVNCGSVLSYAPEVQKVNCSSTENSTCNDTMLPSYDDNSVARVKCSEKLQITLTNGCRGHVNLCMGNMCGGVCSDTWTDDMSVALCKKEKCGDRVLKRLNQPTSKTIIVKSLYAMNEVTDLSQYTYVKNTDNDKSCEQKPAYVVCSGSAKSSLKSSRGQCTGNVEVEYDGRWLPVCKDALNSTTQNVICRELNCGEAIKTVPYFGPTPNSDVIKKIQCKPADRTLSACDITSERTKCELGGLQCSGWRKMALEVNDSCSGQVIVHSEGKRSDVSAEGWTEVEGQRLCYDMNCGNFKKNFTQQAKNANTFWNGTFNCTGLNPKSIWDCEKKKAVPLNNKKLFVECEDKPKGELSNKCHGFVMIKNVQVCESQWNMDYSHMVCQEQNCSNAIGFEFQANSQNKYHVSCDDYHYVLGQCSRVEGSCDRVPDVMCIGAVKLNTSKYCGGEIKLLYNKKKIDVCYEDLGEEMGDKLCRAVGCGGFNTDEPSNFKRISNSKNFQYSLKCTADHKDIKHCIKKESCESNAYNKIYCKGYVKDPEPPPPPTPISVTSVVIGVGLTLLILIVIAVFVRLYFVRKARKSRVLTRMLSGKDMEFESEYEDVNKSNEMEDFGDERFGSEGGSFRGHDARSTSSFPYDDIDVENESRPLAPRSSAAAAASGGDNMHEDGVNYEVDDPRESYDDIEAPPDLTETQAEVHDVLEATPESHAAAGAPPPEPAPGEGDYLVPGQDG